MTRKAIKLLQKHGVAYRVETEPEAKEQVWKIRKAASIFLAHSEGGAKPLPHGSLLKAAIEQQAPSFDAWLSGFKTLAMTRGVGWAILYYDKTMEQLTHAWVEEQHLGQLNGLNQILGLDMWEHSYMLDYAPSEKKKYIEAFFENLNWEVIEAAYKTALQ